MTPPTRGQILAEPAGDQLDRWVDEFVFGALPVTCHHDTLMPNPRPAPGVRRLCSDCGCIWGHDDPLPVGVKRPREAFSFNIAAAWEVVERLAGSPRGQDADGWIIELQAPPNPDDLGRWCAAVYRYDGSGPGLVGADSAPLAICRAALLAVLP